MRLNRLFAWTYKQEVRLHFRSGAVLYFFAKTIKRVYDPGTGALTNLNADGQRGFPFYARLDDISAVTTHNVPFWKRLAA